jgi:hypothetical protein
VINTNVCLYFNLEALGSLNCSPGIKNAKWLNMHKKSLKIPKGGNQKPYIEEEQTTQWPKEKVPKDK